ncbi:MAG: DUF1254 domain-containing protein [Candidatus Acidiferrales bacterium]
MRLISLSKIAAGIVCALVAATVGAQGSATPPNKITMDGDLPAKSSIPEVFRDMDVAQGTQLYLWALPLVAFAQWQYEQEHVFGATSSDLVLYTTYDDKLGILTPNATTPYLMTFVDLGKSGPLVVDMPPGLIAGGYSDFWQREIGAMGELGPDKGQGGKYIVLAPGAENPAPADYRVMRSPGMNVFIGLRTLDPDPQKGMELIRKIKIYPYSQRANPPATRIVTPEGRKWYGGQPDGIAYWERLHAILQSEDVEERDRFFVGQLKSLGIEKGKPFSPTPYQRQVLEESAESGRQMAEVNAFAKRFPNVLHWPDRKWEYVLTMDDSSQRLGDIYQFNERSAWFYEAVTFSNAMKSTTPGAGQAYLSEYSDTDGNWFDGGKSYHLHVGANPPAQNFWSLTLYDTSTRSLVENAQKRADRSSRNDVIKNADGSVDLYFSPAAPAAKEKNWIQTVPGRHWFAYFRLYGPEVPYFDKSWKMDDIQAEK